MRAWLSGWSIRTKVLVSLGMLFLAAAIPGVYAISCMARLNDTVSEVGAHVLPSANILNRASLLAERFRAALALRLLSYDDASRSDMDKLIATARTDASNALADYAALVQDPEEARTANDLRRQWSALLVSSDDISRLVQAGDQSAALNILFTKFRIQTVAFRKNLADIVSLTDHHAAAAANSGAHIYATGRLTLEITLGFALGLSCLTGLFLVRGVSEPIKAISANMRRLADHDLETQIFGLDRTDEIGGMAAAVQVFRDGLSRANALAAIQTANQAVKEAYTANLKRIINAFETRIAETVNVLATSATQLNSTAQALAGSAELTNQQTASAGCIVGEAICGAETVAASADELTASIRAFGEQIMQSTAITARAVECARSTDIIVHGMAESVTRINQIVNLITSIAGRTNLLALNATIEAARAGDAGRGFTVVAGEVKSLANQTAQATDAISVQIGQVQATMLKVVAEVGRIVSVISEASAVATEMTRAVERQNEATGDIVDAIRSTTMKTLSVSVAIFDVRQAVDGTGATATQILAAADHLASQADELKAEVNRFLIGVQTA